MLPSKNLQYSSNPPPPSSGAPVINQTTSSYQNGSVYNNGPQSFPVSQPSYPRSPLQSPLESNKQSFQNYSNNGEYHHQNYNSQQNQRNVQQPLSTPPTATATNAIPNYNTQQNVPLATPISPIINQPARINSQMYQVNGFPNSQTGNYPQYPVVPPSLNNRYPGVRFFFFIFVCFKLTNVFSENGDFQRR